MSCHYTAYAKVMDYGPHITKIVLKPECSLAGAFVEPDLFEVSVERSLPGGAPLEWPAFMGKAPKDLLSGTRTVTASYLCDEAGNPLEDGSCLALELACDPRRGIGSTIIFDGNFNVPVEYTYSVKLQTPIMTDEGIILEFGDLIHDATYTEYADLLKDGLHKDPDIDLGYCYYIPKAASGEKLPLIIWLHGAGEGGKTPVIAATGNKVTAFLDPKNQEIFGGKAILYAPQSPTMWMDDGSGQYTKDGSSCYVEALERAIADFVKDHQDLVDESRIYLGGCSNGGYMTLKMLIRNPERYAACYPICEALSDGAISDADLASIRNTPIWFTQAANDDVVPPITCAIPTYQRLIAAGASKVHFSFYKDVHDQTGQYTLADGTPYQYPGHWSWIYTLNNDCSLDFDGTPVLLDGEPTHILNWLAVQKKA